MRIKTGGTGAILSHLFIKILQDNGVLNEKGEGLRFGVLMENFLKDPRNRVPTDSKSRSGVRTNMNRALLDDEMTWKTFFTGLLFLNAASAKFGIMHFNNKGDHRHMVEFNVSTSRQPDIHALTTIFKGVRNALNVDEDVFGMLVERHLIATHECDSKDKELTVVKNYRLKELLAGSITWKTLMKAFAIMKIETFIVFVEIMSVSGKTHYCEITVNTGARTEMELKHV